LLKDSCGGADIQGGAFKMLQAIISESIESKIYLDKSFVSLKET